MKSEDVGLWYLRLNGFLTIPNFVVHPESGRNQRTDIDVLGVRFPHRRELLENPMKDDPDLLPPADRVFLAITEIKRGPCALNGPWTNPDLQNMERVLSAVGLFASKTVRNVAKHLYQIGAFTDKQRHAAFLCVGNAASESIRKTHREARQVTWEDVFRFIFRRFTTYYPRKLSHGQWDATGRALWRSFERSRGDEDKFIEHATASLQ